MPAVPEPDIRTDDLLRAARLLIAADAYAVWKVGTNGVWQVRSFAGVSPTFTHRIVEALNRGSVPVAPFPEPRAIEDVFSAPRLQERAHAYAEEGIASMLAIPLGAAGAAMATLSFYYRAPHHFTPVEMETAHTLANVAAVAVTTAELYDEQRRMKEQAAFLAQASAALSDSLEFETTLNTVARLSVPGIADSCAIHLLDEDGDIRLVAAVHVDPAKAAAMQTIADPKTAEPSRTWVRTIREGTSALLADILPADVRRLLGGDEQLIAIFDTLGFTSQISVPLRARGRTIGGITFTLGPGVRRYDPADVRLAEDLAQRAAIAVDNARLYRAAQEGEAAAALGQRRARLLADVGAALASSLNYEATLKTVANLAVPEMADWCAVDILDDQGSLQRVAIVHSDPAKVHLADALSTRIPEPQESRQGVWQVMRTGQATLVPAVTDEMIAAVARDAGHLRFLREIGLTSYISVPLIARGRAFGVITFASAESGRRYSDHDLRFAQDVASRVALAVDNARVYKQANDANRLKDEFLGTLSHELRTPLNAILGYARMLRSGVWDDVGKQARALEILERNAQALTQMVEDVLDTSRIISGKLRLNLRPVDLPAVVADAVATVLPAADAKGVVVNVSVDRSVPPVQGDSERLQQVVWNLLTNAVKFTDRGGAIHVELEPRESYACVVVSDTGRGVSEDFLPHILDRKSGV